MLNLLKIVLAALALLALTLVVNAGVFDANWRWDDTQILLHSHQYSFWQDFTRPQVWQQFSPANLTPWLIFSFEVDMILFGLTPAAFYLHQLLAIAAAGTIDRVLDAPSPVCWMTEFGSSSLDFKLRFWIADPQAGLTNVRGKVLIAMWDIFKENGVNIPFPHREIIMRTPVEVVRRVAPDAEQA